MRHKLLVLAALGFSAIANAQENPLWLRYCAISPDGTQIAFTYKGDIYTVPSVGGKATQLTTNAAHDTHPVWSPDGTQIAFSSAREGSMDVYIMSKEGGAPRRLTSHSGGEFPIAFLDNDRLLFAAAVMPDAQDMTFPSSQFPQVYEGRTSCPVFINSDGGHQRQKRRGFAVS